MNTPAECMTAALTLTPVEEAAGVDVNLVRAVARDSLPLVDGVTIVMDDRFGPAVAQAAARLRLAGPVEFVGMNYAQLPVYRLAS